MTRPLPPRLLPLSARIVAIYDRCVLASGGTSKRGSSSSIRTEALFRLVSLLGSRLFYRRRTRFESESVATGVPHSLLPIIVAGAVTFIVFKRDRLPLR